MKAIDYIRKGWAQGTFAKDENGVPVLSVSERACSWCAYGAINAAYNESMYSEFVNEYYSAIEKFRAVIKERRIADWNDAPERTHAEVIAAFEQAGI